MTYDASAELEFERLRVSTAARWTNWNMVELSTHCGAWALASFDVVLLIAPVGERLVIAFLIG